MKIKNLTVIYGAVQFLFWVGYSAIVGFASVYLTDAGFDSTEIGMVLALGAALSVLLQPMVAAYADKESAPSLRVIIAALVLILMVFDASLALVRGSRAGTAALFVVCLAIVQTITPLINALGIQSASQGKPMNYGVARGGGSLGYAVGAYLFGLLTARIGAASLLAAFPVAYILLFAAVLVMPFTRQRLPRSGEKSQRDDPISFFRRYPRFGIVLLGAVLSFLGHMLINSFTLQIVQSKGGGSEEMGIAVAIATVTELPTMLLFSRMTKKVRVDIWFRVSGIFLMLKTLGTMLVPNVFGLCLVMTLQMMAWALIAISAVYYIDAIMAPRDAVKGQAYFTMSYTISNVLSALVCGPIIDHCGVNTALGVATVAAVIGMGILLFATEKTTRNAPV